MTTDVAVKKHQVSVLDVLRFESAAMLDETNSGSIDVDSVPLAFIHNFGITGRNLHAGL